jgi:hypothetical protein
VDTLIEIPVTPLDKENDNKEKKWKIDKLKNILRGIDKNVQGAEIA